MVRRSLRAQDYPRDSHTSGELPGEDCERCSAVGGVMRSHANTWTIHDCGNGIVAVCSSEAHDTCLRVDGDFESHLDKLKLAEWIASALNAKRRGE